MYVMKKKRKLGLKKLTFYCIKGLSPQKCLRLFGAPQPIFRFRHHLLFEYYYLHSFNSDITNCHE